MSLFSHEGFTEQGNEPIQTEVMVWHPELWNPELKQLGLFVMESAVLHDVPKTLGEGPWTPARPMGAPANFRSDIDIRSFNLAASLSEGDFDPIEPIDAALGE